MSSLRLARHRAEPSVLSAHVEEADPKKGYLAGREGLHGTEQAGFGQCCLVKATAMSSFLAVCELDSQCEMLAVSAAAVTFHIQ
jgi:hypothetical protein